MIRSLQRISTQIFYTNKQSNLTLTHLRFLKTPISKNPEEPNSPDFTVSYLINSCGLSPQSALSTSKKIKLKSPENPNSILNFLKSRGFTNTQIANLVTKCPILIASNWDKTIKPKFYYLQSAGYSSSDLASLISSIPHILTASLENRLKPNFELLKSIIGSNKLIASALRQTTRLIQGNLETNFLPNVKTLESCGIPNTSIAKLAGLHPRVILMPNEQFKVTVELIREMGFNPLSTMFVHGVAAVSRFNHSTWKKKLGVYKSLGWSQKEVMSAFAKQPFCMLLSEKKIRKAVDFYVKELKWGPSFLSAHPVLLNLSLEKRVMPRCSVTSLLEAKGLMTKSSSVHFLMITEKDFLDKYVIRYKNQIPKLLDAYRADSQKACSEAIL